MAAMMRPQIAALSTVFLEYSKYSARDARQFGLTRPQYIHKSGYMETEEAVLALAALAQSTRLEAFRTLVKHEPDGLAAGELARLLEVPQNTLSAHLSILSRARARHLRAAQPLDRLSRQPRRIPGRCASSCCRIAAAAAGDLRARRRKPSSPAVRQNERSEAVPDQMLQCALPVHRQFGALDPCRVDPAKGWCRPLPRVLRRQHAEGRGASAGAAHAGEHGLSQRRDALEELAGVRRPDAP